MGSQRIMNKVCWITDAIDFEANLHHSPKTCKFYKIAEKFVIKMAISKNLHVFGEWWRFASKSIASVIQQTLFMILWEPMDLTKWSSLEEHLR